MLGTCILRVGRAVLGLPPGAEAWGGGMWSQKLWLHRPPGTAAPQPTAELYHIAPSGHTLVWKREDSWERGCWDPHRLAWGLVSMCPLSAWGLMKAWGDPSLWT